MCSSDLAPTQVGVAWPKYYAWVTAHGDSGRVEEGAVRVAAVDATHFEVTDISLREIRADPEGVERVFPRALCDGLRRRAGVPSR